MYDIDSPGHARPQPRNRSKREEKMRLVLLCSAVLCTATALTPSAFRPRTPRFAPRAAAPVALDAAREKLIRGGLPQKFAERVSFQSSGQRIAGQEDEILILWKEFQK